MADPVTTVALIASVTALAGAALHLAKEWIWPAKRIQLIKEEDGKEIKIEISDIGKLTNDEIELITQSLQNKRQPQ
jgi:predicted nicotinamide N-methyase